MYSGSVFYDFSLIFSQITGVELVILALLGDQLILHPNMHGNSSKTHICTIYRLSVICVRLNKSGNEEKI